MPTYQYACTACGEQLEAVQAFTDAPLTECPACAGRLRKVFSAVGVVFKGSGFYKTDSRSNNGAGKGGDGADKDGAGKDGSTPAKTDSTPAAKSEPAAKAGAAKSESAAPAAKTA